MTIINIFEIVGRVTKNIYLTKANDGQDVAHCRIAVGNTYMNLYASGPIGQAMAHQIKRGMYVKLNVKYHDSRCSGFANKPYGVLHFEKLYKQAYDNYQPYQPCGHKCGQVVRLALEGNNGKGFVIPAYGYCADHTPAAAYCISHVY